MEKLWYAVQMDSGDNDWGYGSFDLEEAKRLARNYGEDACVVAIDGGFDAAGKPTRDPVAVWELHGEELCAASGSIQTVDDLEQYARDNPDSLLNPVYGEQKTEQNFTLEQLKQIQLGTITGLTDEQIALYANPQFNTDQMAEIRTGLQNGLSTEQVNLYADPKFLWEQMEEIRWGLEGGLTAEQVALYADPKFDEPQMLAIRSGLKDGLTQEQIALYADTKFNEDQMWQVRLGLENGLTKEEMMLYADPRFSWEKMFQVRQGLEYGVPLDKVKSYADPEISWEKMDETRKRLQAKQRLQQKKKKNPQQSYSINLNGQAVTVQAGSEQEAALKAVEQLESQAAPQNQKQEPTQAPTGPKLTM